MVIYSRPPPRCWSTEEDASLLVWFSSSTSLRTRLCNEATKCFTRFPLIDLVGGRIHVSGKRDDVWLQLKKEGPWSIYHWRRLECQIKKQCWVILQDESQYSQYRQSSKGRRSSSLSSGYSLLQRLRRRRASVSDLIYESSEIRRWARFGKWPLHTLQVKYISLSALLCSDQINPDANDLKIQRARTSAKAEWSSKCDSCLSMIFLQK